MIKNCTKKEKSRRFWCHTNSNVNICNKKLIKRLETMFDTSLTIGANKNPISIRFQGTVGSKAC